MAVPPIARGLRGHGDRQYAHKVLVALCRLAVEYAYLATMTQHRHRNSVSQVERFGQGRFDEGPAWRPAALPPIASSSPPTVESCRGLRPYLPVIDQTGDHPVPATEGLCRQDHQDVRPLVEENLFAVWVQGIMDKACATMSPGSRRRWHARRSCSTTPGAPTSWTGSTTAREGCGSSPPTTTSAMVHPTSRPGGYNAAHVSIWPRGGMRWSNSAGSAATLHRGALSAT